MIPSRSSATRRRSTDCTPLLAPSVRKIASGSAAMPSRARMNSRHRLADEAVALRSRCRRRGRAASRREDARAACRRRPAGTCPAGAVSSELGVLGEREHLAHPGERPLPERLRVPDVAVDDAGAPAARAPARARRWGRGPRTRPRAPRGRCLRDGSRRSALPRRMEDRPYQTSRRARRREARRRSGAGTGSCLRGAPRFARLCRGVTSPVRAPARMCNVSASWAAPRVVRDVQYTRSAGRSAGRRTGGSHVPQARPRAPACSSPPASRRPPRTRTWGEPYGADWARYGHVESVRETVQRQQGDPARRRHRGRHHRRHPRQRLDRRPRTAARSPARSAARWSARRRARARPSSASTRSSSGSTTAPSRPSSTRAYLPFAVGEPVALTAQGLARTR